VLYFIYIHIFMTRIFVYLLQKTFKLFGCLIF